MSLVEMQNWCLQTQMTFNNHDCTGVMIKDAQEALITYVNASRDLYFNSGCEWTLCGATYGGKTSPARFS